MGSLCESSAQPDFCGPCYPGGKPIQGMPPQECINTAMSWIDGLKLECAAAAAAAPFKMTATGKISNDVECGEDEVKIYAIGNKKFGAKFKSDCVQACTLKSEAAFIKDTAQGSCEELGYEILRKRASIELENAPMPISVLIFRMAKPNDYNCPPQADTKVAMSGEMAAEYGALAKECAEMCMPEQALGFIPGAKAGTCKRKGYAKFDRDTEVTKMGQAVPVKVYKRKLVKRLPRPPPKVIECERGMTKIAFYDPEMVEMYGGSGNPNSKECVEICYDKTALELIARAEESSCAELGYPVWKAENMVRSMELRGEVDANVFKSNAIACPRLTRPFQASNCPRPIKLGWYGNAFGKCTKAIGCGPDRKKYLRKLFFTKNHCEKAIRNHC